MALDYTQNDYYPSEYGGDAPDSSRLGYYQYISLEDLINNFMFEKTGQDSLLGSVPRNKVAYQIQRSIQMLNYDVLKVTRALSTEMNTDTLSVPLPQDCVNVIGVAFLDNAGNKHAILPQIYVSTGQEYSQDNDFKYLFGDQDELLEIIPNRSIRDFQDPQLGPEGFATGQYFYGSGFNDFEHPYSGGYFKRYGLNPELANENGHYVLDNEKGIMYFSSVFTADTNNIVIDYVSDGLADDDDNIRVNKMAEEAVYKMAEYKILSNKPKEAAPDYIIRRVKKESFTEMRNAEIRFMNLRLPELAQVFRNQNKWIKH